MRSMQWFVYVLWSPHLERSYVGIALDPRRRLRQHNGDIQGGAKSTRAGRPWQLRVAYGPFADRSAASSAEYAIKQRRGEERWKSSDLPYAVAEGPEDPGSPEAAADRGPG